MFQRVSFGVQDYYDLMAGFDFLPNSPTLMNAGLGNGTLSACFRFDVKDTMLGESGIMDVARKAAAVQKFGGGVGYDFSQIRPKGSPISTTHGKACGPIAVMKHMHSIAQMITQGGKREGAQMGILHADHPDIEEFIHSKDSDPQGLNTFNISVATPDRFFEAATSDHNSQEARLLSEIAESAWTTGDPGIYCIDTAERYNPTPWLGKLRGTNPCFTGDTLIAVADGRGSVSIKDLTSGGRDVPVYCSDSRGKVHVRYGRNPRITKYQAPVYNILFDDGSRVTTTKDHKFILSTGEVKEAGELVFGDSIAILVKKRAKFEEMISHSNSRSQEYYWMRSGNEKSWKLEHRLIANFVHGPIGYKIVVHHKDRDGLNNSIDNLEILSKKEHDALHSLDMMGDRNPVNRFPEKNPFRNKEVQKKIREEHHLGKKRTQETRNNISAAVRKAYSDEGHRRNLSNGVKAWFGLHRDIFEEGLAKRAVTKLNSLKALTDLPLSIIGNNVVVTKHCETCGIELILPFSKRERSYCSISCANKATHTKEYRERIVYSNHKVSSVEFAGYEDVYNLTVDEFHNLYIGGFISEDTKETTFINTRQCGEVPLLNDEPCNLGSINLTNFVLSNNNIDWARLESVAKTATRFLDTVLDNNTFPDPAITKAAYTTRKLGLGVMGWADMLALLRIPYDSEEAINLGTRIMHTIHDAAWCTSEELATEKGPFPGVYLHPEINDIEAYDQAMSGFYSGVNHRNQLEDLNLWRRNATVTCIAPTGTISIIVGCSSGIEPHFAIENERTMGDGTVLMEKIPVMSRLNGFRPKTAMNINYEYHIKHQVAFQEFTDLATSKTINLPKSATVEDIRNSFIMLWKLGCRGGTIFRDGCREGVLKDTSMAEEKHPEPNVRILPAHRVRVRTGHGTLYTTLTYKDDKPFEVFSNLGKAGGCDSAQLEAISRLISLAYRTGVPTAEIIKQLSGITCCPVWDEGNQVKSVADGLAWAISEATNEGKPVVESNHKEPCPDCGSSLTHQEGCVSCVACGYSRC